MLSISFQDGIILSIIFGPIVHSMEDFLTFFFAFSAISWAIKISSVEVPQYPVVGTSVSQLVCNYDLDRVGDGPEDKLYSVKWYKDGNEFYR